MHGIEERTARCRRDERRVELTWRLLLMLAFGCCRSSASKEGVVFKEERGMLKTVQDCQK